MNLQTYIFFGIAFAFVLLLLCALMIVKKFRPKITEILKGILEKTFFNNTIKSINLSYLKSALAFAIGIISLTPEASFGTRLSKTAPLFAYFMIPVGFTYAMYRFRAELNQKDMRSRIERAYIDIHLHRNSWTIYYYPIFLFRRFFFVFIPILFHGYVTFQLQGFIMLSLFYSMYYLGIRPHSLPAKHYIEASNDIMILLLSYHMICFTDFVLSIEAQY